MIYGEADRQRRLNQDRKAWDGLFYAGWRLVRKGGWVKAGGQWYQNDQLLPWVGKKVWFVMNDYWTQEAFALGARWDAKLFICNLRNTTREK